MLDSDLAQEIIAGLKDGSVVPYIGPGALADVTNKADNSPMPADSDSLILAMNNGQPMAPRLMYEFPRAAMNLELKKGRSYVERFLTETYGTKQWTRAAFHDWLASIQPKYVIDINRDTQLQESYSAIAHTLIVGCARLSGTDYRFKIYHYDGSSYKAVDQEAADPSLPILFKPMGTPLPEPSYIAADADYVDYITELMGGFAIPSFLKEYRTDKKYLFIGMAMTRDTERMVLSDIVYSAGSPTGWAVMPAPTDKERRFCNNKKIEVIEASWQELLAASQSEATPA
ncbi:SIR2 family protein [Halioxenophilus sp. WMMB6]|uniref:SIR2 family protein n=1 Tax=Halioxenophilus sp. WMMB6 TaxID=3073815 RepID=UPI00295EF2B9|nr:SIR2 family protein [Halioxenophilus sp. WMMB6]